ncbi:MAG: class I SAM-dependent methyltransferase, partial [Nitrospiraceae bacterium]
MTKRSGWCYVLPVFQLHETPPAKPVLPPPEGTVPDWSGKGKEQAVQRMFTAIARWYDLNNSLLSFGLHHRWKRRAVKYLFEPSASACGLRSGEVSAEPRYALDIGAGTGDLALLIQPRMGDGGRVAAVDLNQAMLREGL